MRYLSVILAVAACAGCTTSAAQKEQAPAAKEDLAVAPPTPTGPTAADPQSAWVKGKVFRVWPYGRGELMAYLGTKDGIRTGDMLALQRGGLTLNSIEVLDVHEDTFYGRVVRRDDAGVWPKEGDLAVVIPPTGP